MEYHSMTGGSVTLLAKYKGASGMETEWRYPELRGDSEAAGGAEGAEPTHTAGMSARAIAHEGAASFPFLQRIRPQKRLEPAPQMSSRCSPQLKSLYKTRWITKVRYLLRHISNGWN
ncbi:unnamed protein product [Orchesella dallaii]|uniref:Uncharacterized protein n=1 Tax=Orchesella dallaii TaxID=48710 RepID=A0ABP1R946_9HEXA